MGLSIIKKRIKSFEIIRKLIINIVKLYTEKGFSMRNLALGFL